jgi:ABC-type glutathione transport system ATPase component
MNALLDVRRISVEYRGADGDTHAAVADVSFELGAGEVLGLAGESGCGKTTLALALMGLLPKDLATGSGSAVFARQNILAMDERALQKIRGAQISFIAQEPSLALSPVLRAGDQIAEVLHAHKDWSWKRCREETESWLVHVGLEPSGRFYRAYPHQLSGGQLQRVALAQALACGPQLLIADEPTAALDARNQANFVALLRNLKAQLNLSVLLISHTPEIHASLADRVLVMKGGRVIEEGMFAQLYASASDPYTRAMLRPGARKLGTLIGGNTAADASGICAR